MAPADGSDRSPPGPEPAYRPSRAYEAPDTSMRNLALGAVAIALVVMGGVWFLSGRTLHPGVPVIEAEHTPVRIKPANPGGMQVAGADDPAVDTGAVETDRLAPPPETPAPQALQRAARAALPAPGPAIVPAPGPAPGPAPMAAPVVAPVVAPLVAPVVAPVKPVVAVTAAPRGAAVLPRPRASPYARPGAGEVQLGALESEAAARAAWAALDRRVPDLLAGHEPRISRVELDGKMYWRLRTGGFADIAAATSWCARMRSRGGSGCAIASF